MTAWSLTHGLINLRNQVNALAPGRDKRSDGTIGDLAHQDGASDHNPDDTAGARPAWSGDPDKDAEVRAWDMDADLNLKGVTAQKLVDHIAGLPRVDTVLRYMIFNRKIYHARDGFEPKDYEGASPHTEHIHFSGAWTQAGDENATFDFRLKELLPIPPKKEDDMPTADEIAKAVWGYKFDDPYTTDDPKNPAADDKTAGTMQRYADSAGQGKETRAALEDVNARLSRQEGVLNEILAALKPAE